MKNLKIEINYQEFEDINELTTEDKGLLMLAMEAASKAYAPYSNFHVGAVILLENGVLVSGNNQENAAYPSGLCAERVALFSASAQHPGIGIKTLALSAYSDNFLVDSPVTPCGACRQVMTEYENRQGKPIRLILSGQQGKILVLEKVSEILPFKFDGSALKK